MSTAMHGATAQSNGAHAQLLDADAQLLSTTAQLTRQSAEQAHLVGRDIVCFANDWSGDPLSKKHVMTRLAKHNRVLWVNSLGNRAPRATARDLGRIFDKLKKLAGQLTTGPV